jgi:hypothetical protein
MEFNVKAFGYASAANAKKVIDFRIRENGSLNLVKN